MEFDDILRDLCDAVPNVIGAVLCDFEGETVVSALGSASPPEEAAQAAQEHVPKNVALTMSVPEFLVRLAGAEPCALLRLFGEQCRQHSAGELEGLSVSFRQIRMFVRRLPEDFYVVLVVRRPAVVGQAVRHLGTAAERLTPHLL